MSLSGKVAGDASVGLPITCWLFEGTITRGVAEGRTGLDIVTVTRGAPLVPGDRVELFDDASIDYDTLGGLPVVRKVQTAGATYCGEVVSQPDRAANIPPNSTPVTTLSAMIAGGYLRKATVEFDGLMKIKLVEILVPLNGGGADSIDVGVVSGLKWDISAGGYVYEAAGSYAGVGVVPMHHIEGSTSVDVTKTCLIGFGMIATRVVA